MGVVRHFTHFVGSPSSLGHPHGQTARRLIGSVMESFQGTSRREMAAAGADDVVLAVVPTVAELLSLTHRIQQWASMG